MAKRSQDWNEGLAEDLRDFDFARDFIVSAVDDEDLSLQEALGKVIRAYGVAEFAEEVGVPESNIIRAVNPKHNPTTKTLNQLLEPFGLRLGVSRLDHSA